MREPVKTEKKKIEPTKPHGRTQFAEQSKRTVVEDDDDPRVYTSEREMPQECGLSMGAGLATPKLENPESLSCCFATSCSVRELPTSCRAGTLV